MLLACMFAITRCEGVDPFIVRGTVTVEDCSSRVLEAGDLVTVTAGGETVGRGELSVLPSLGQQPPAGTCVLVFVIDDIDDDHDVYEISFGSRPAMKFDRDELDDPLDLPID